jgi:hypothetical protein
MTRERRRPAQWLIVACGVWLVGLGLYFIFVRPSLLPEDPQYMGVDPQRLLSTAPRLADWLDKVFTVMGGFMAGAGVLTIQLGWNVMPLRARATLVVLALAGALTVGVMSAVNFALHSDFRWLLLGPPLVWLVAVILYAMDLRR